MTTLFWIHELVKQAGEDAKAKGFWHEEDTFGDLIALAHTELSEALEAYRDTRDVHKVWTDEKGKLQGVPTELADEVIRIADICARYGIDLAYWIAAKLENNRTRPHKHGNRVLHA